MTENGVSYVWILAEDEEENNGTVIVLPQTHEHEFHYIETVKPCCEELGYDRFQCNGCGQLEKRNYIPATGHDYDEIVIREATCKQGGLVLTLCRDCGDYYQETTALGAHKYHTERKNPTCRIVGYDEHTCEVCGDSYITNMTPIINHAYERVTKAPDCVNKGYSTYLKLIKAAKMINEKRLLLLMKVFCATGIRVSEIKHITINALNTGEFETSFRGVRKVISFPEDLRTQLLDFAHENNIINGCVFVTKNGNPLDRSRICKELKDLSYYTDVPREKIDSTK